MKWNNFIRTLRENPDLATLICSHIGSPALASAPLNFSKKVASVMLMEYVEKKVDFVAFRDLANLDLKSGNARSVQHGVSGPEESAVRFILYRTFSVCFQILEMEEAGHRLAYVEDERDRKSYIIQGFPDLAISTTIQAVINSRLAWYNLYWANQGKTLRFNAVFRKSTEWRVDDRGEQLYSEVLDIFRLPNDEYTFPALKNPE